MTIILLQKNKKQKQTNKQQKQQKDNNNNTNNNSNNEPLHLFMRDKLGNGIKLLKVLKSSDMDNRNSKQRFFFYKLVS